MTKISTCESKKRKFTKAHEDTKSIDEDTRKRANEDLNTLRRQRIESNKRRKINNRRRKAEAAAAAGAGAASTSPSPAPAPVPSCAARASTTTAAAADAVPSAAHNDAPAAARSADTPSGDSVAAGAPPAPVGALGDLDIPCDCADAAAAATGVDDDAPAADDAATGVDDDTPVAATGAASVSAPATAAANTATTTTADDYVQQFVSDHENINGFIGWDMWSTSPPTFDIYEKGSVFSQRQFRASTSENLRVAQPGPAPDYCPSHLLERRATRDEIFDDHIQFFLQREMYFLGLRVVVSGDGEVFRAPDNEIQTEIERDTRIPLIMDTETWLRVVGETNRRHRLRALHDAGVRAATAAEAASASAVATATVVAAAPEPPVRAAAAPPAVASAADAASTSTAAASPVVKTEVEVGVASNADPTGAVLIGADTGEEWGTPVVKMEVGVDIAGPRGQLNTSGGKK